MGVQIAKRISFHSFFFNQTFQKIPSDGLRKSWYSFFEIPNLKVFKTELKF